MFTGIIECSGTVTSSARSQAGGRLTITPQLAGFMDDVKDGDSISIDGVCLTAVGVTRERFSADVAPLTLERTTLGSLSAGDRVNLERAMAGNSRFGGHIVSGHVDAVGSITAKRPKGDSLIITVSAPADLLAGLIDRGSVAVDGISLTVASLDDDGFSVSIIPHTSLVTTLTNKGAGSQVNLEADIIGKYVRRILSPYLGESAAAGASGIDLDTLRRNGFA